MEKFRTWLSERMLERGFNYRRADLARDLGLRATTVSDWFNKSTLPTDEAIWELARWASRLNHIVEPTYIYSLLGVPAPENHDPLEYRWSLLFSWLKPEDVNRIMREIQMNHLLADQHEKRASVVPDADRRGPQTHPAAHGGDGVRPKKRPTDRAKKT